MAGVNKVIIVGNLGADPETKYAQSGEPVTKFRVATSFKTKDQERTEWHSIVCFKRLAEIAGEYLRKGSKVYVEGQLQTSSWEKDGEKRYRTEIIARELQMLDGRQSDTPRQESRPAPRIEAPALDLDDDDDIPFN